MSHDPIKADDLAMGALLRVLAQRVAKLENPERPDDAFDDVRDFTVRAIGAVPIAGTTAAQAIRIRAHAQVVVQHLLEPAE